MSQNVLKLGRMLKNVRHISEGNFYGLHVTNKAKNVSLDKKLKTLEACKDAQTHCYRKEEKDLVNTLVRLQKSKDQYYHNNELITRHHGEKFLRGDLNFKQHGQKYKNQGSSDSIILPATPKPSAHDVTKIPAQSPQRKREEHHESTEIGSVIHRTTGFTDCVICRLPRSSHVSGTDVCRCEKGPDRGTHHMHPVAFHEDRSRPEYLHSKERQELFEKLHPSHHDDRHERQTGKKLETSRNEREFIEKLNQEMHHVIETPLQPYKEGEISSLPWRRGSFGNEKGHVYKENGMSSPPGRRGSFGHIPYKDNGHEGRRGSLSNDKGPRRNTLLEDERLRNRNESIIEEGPYTVPRGQRRKSIDYESLRKRMDSISAGSYYSVGELRSRTSTAEDSETMRKTFKVTHSAMYPSSPPERKSTLHSNQGFSVHDHSHLPKLPQNGADGGQEAFHGLIHPDNIINHHHYLPYEADKQVSKRHHHGDYQHDNHRHDDHHHHDKRHFHGYYVHKYDHMGTRQIAHIPIGAQTHIAEMLEKQHEPDSHHLTLLSNLRHLLSVYQRLDETLPRYPWPTPPHVEMTKDEFQKLKDCR